MPGPGGVYLVPGVGTWSGGVHLPGGCTWSGGTCPGGYLPGGCTWSQGGLYLVPGGGVVPGAGGVYLVPGGVPDQVLPPPCGQTHACQNITFATSLRTVKMSIQKAL